MSKSKKTSLREKGITLIALVVTIIVLLILAGITIGLVLGQNGLIERTKDSKEYTIIQEEKEAIGLALNYCLIDETKGTVIDKNTGTYDLRGNMEHQLEIQEHPAEVVENEGKLTITFDITGHIFTVDSNGVITEGNGIETAEDPAEVYGYENSSNEKVEIDDLQVGDHINYYYSTSIQPIECIVIYKDTIHGVQVITKDVTEDIITLGYTDPKIPSSAQGYDFTGSNFNTMPEKFKKCMTNYDGRAAIDQYINFEKARWSYNNAISTLNSYASKYKGLMSVDERCVGSNPKLGQKNADESNAMITTTTTTRWRTKVGRLWFRE